MAEQTSRVLLTRPKEYIVIQVDRVPPTSEAVRRTKPARDAEEGALVELNMQFRSLWWALGTLVVAIIAWSAGCWTTRQWQLQRIEGELLTLSLQQVRRERSAEGRRVGSADAQRDLAEEAEPQLTELRTKGDIAAVVARRRVGRCPPGAAARP